MTTNDAILEALVSSVEGTSLTPGVTLTINGFVVSGLLVSSETYANFMKEEVAGGISDPEIVASLHAAIDSSPSTGFIHLRDAKIMADDDEVPGGNGVLWRGKLSEVNGFTLGVFS